MRYSAWNRQARAFRLPKWQLALVLVLALALGIAVAIVATGIVLIVLPIAAVVALGYRLFGGARRRDRPPAGVIEGEYEVVEPARRDRNRGSGAS
jgi:4-hydroxybenzoate polyprenyltransferase